MSLHLLTVLVEDKPGVLARVATMFARRGFNIHSLAVGPSEEDELSRMTIVVDAPNLEQVTKQLQKLVNTLKVVELSAEESIEREVMLIRINADPGHRSAILDAAAVFKAKPVDVGATTITFEVVGDPSKLDDFQELMRPYGVVSLVKSGRIALAREPKARNLRAIS